MAKKTKLSVYILLDRSGSMGGSKWENAIGSINTYVQGLRNEKVDADITVAAFDSHGYSNGLYNNARGGMQMFPKNMESVASDPIRFELLRNEVNISSYNDIATNECHPRGGTPLYDSTAKLLNMADKNNNAKTVILIMTDGEENESRTYNLTSIRDRIATCQHRGWEVLFLGAEFNAETVARNYGLHTSKVLNTTRSVMMGDAMNFYSTASASYASTGKGIDTTLVKNNISK